MNPQAINKLKRKYKVDDKDLVSAMLYVVSDNKTYSYINGVGQKSEAKASSMAVISGRYFGNTNMLALVDELRNRTKVFVDEPEIENEKLSINDNNKTDIELSPNMSNAELVEYFTSRINSVRDPNKKFEYELKLLDKLDIKANTAIEDGNKPLIYLPQRCETCPHKIANSPK